MIKINPFRSEPFDTPGGGEKIIQAMLKNAYNQGLLAGETRAYWKVIDLLHAEELKFLSILDRRTAQRPDMTRKVEALRLERTDTGETHFKGGFTEKK